MRQPSLSAPTRFSAGTSDVGEEHLGEVGGAAQVPQRAHLDARRVHVDDEQADALVLRRVRVGAHVAEAHLGDPSRSDVHTFCPLMTKWSPSSTARVCRPARSEPAFGSLIPMHQTVSPRIAAGTSCLLLVVPNSSRLGATIAYPGKCIERGHADGGHLLEVDERLDRGRVATAELGRVARDHPAVVEQRRLPVARPLRDQRAVAAADATSGEVVAGRVASGGACSSRKRELGAEGLVLGAPTPGASGRSG